MTLSQLKTSIEVDPADEDVENSDWGSVFTSHPLLVYKKISQIHDPFTIIDSGYTMYSSEKEMHVPLNISVDENYDSVLLAQQAKEDADAVKIHEYKEKEEETQKSKTPQSIRER